jgi:hypothetical protein
MSLMPPIHVDKILSFQHGWCKEDSEGLYTEALAEDGSCRLGRISFSS